MYGIKNILGMWDMLAKILHPPPNPVYLNPLFVRHLRICLGRPKRSPPCSFWSYFWCNFHLMRYGHFESFCNMDIIFEQSKCTYIIIMYNELKLWIWKFIWYLCFVHSLLDLIRWEVFHQQMVTILISHKIIIIVTFIKIIKFTRENAILNTEMNRYTWSK